MVEIRDAAEASGVEPTQLRAGMYDVRFRIAPIPMGWAWRAGIHYNVLYSGTPWTGPYASRADAAAEVAVFLGRFLHSPQGGASGKTKIIGLINASLQGDA
ncbi:hypothetical protein G7070_07050 [Propioniciclava coleopterorum]|uniref:Uncharacterized protein n=1 Tax=Propioniciclava coleopterorum TaxID=2714937 RepID=A0A6G7Y5Z8_9ACTN|nr:hypothetical protein [Propioniciclava coleopterorum]QIK72068.1 hypothetical protein G7070_07050 [Propioniciclava coleopterorum]